MEPHVVVYDRPDVREIGFPSLFDPYTPELAQRILRDGVRVTLRGIDQWRGKGNCSINLLWASSGM